MKQQRYMKRLKNIPLSFSGISLAVASLGNMISIHGPQYKTLCGFLSITAVLLVSLKIFYFKSDFISELKNIQNTGTFPTYFLTFMVLAGYGDVHFRGINLSKILWLVSLLCHLSFILLFAFIHRQHFNRQYLYPNWFVTFVAHAVAGIGAPHFGEIMLGKISVAIGLTFYFILFPLILYRVLAKQIPELFKPSIWLFNSPINICITAYLSSYAHSVNPYFLLTLCWFSLFSFVMTLFAVDFKAIFHRGFQPSVTAFTFPTVIFITAFGRSYEYYRQIGWLNGNITPLIRVLEVLCAALVFGILTGYTQFVLKQK